MFRIGGSAGTGITSGLNQPQQMAKGGRINYQQGTTPNFQFAGMPGFLTQFGLNLLSTPPQGNIFQTSAVAAKDPFNVLQAQLDAQREAVRQATFQPQEQLDRFAGQVTGLMGGYPAQFRSTITPNLSPLQTALGVGTTLAGIYGAVKAPGNVRFNLG